MAPSVRSRISKRQARPDSCAFRVTKSSKLNIQAEVSKQKIDAIEECIQAKSKPQPQLPKQELSSSKKRRRDESDLVNEEGATRAQEPLKKARPTTTLLTPPTSSPEPECLPETLQELVALHKVFVQALTVHFAHNGSRDAVPLLTLMPSMTRLWKRKAVTLQDIQRMLAIWECTSTTATQEVTFSRGPFKLITTGIGANQQTRIEYAWQNAQSTSIDAGMHAKYEKSIQKLHQRAQIDPVTYAFVHETLLHFPILKCQIGSQTQMRQEKISSTRDYILSKTEKAVPAKPSTATATTEPDFTKLNINEPLESTKPTSYEDKLKSRTLGLFDRLKAKQIANSSSATPTSAELSRRCALHRIPDVLDVLRLKQSQKLNTLFRSDMDGLVSGTRAPSMKVSFSLEQLVQEIRDSGRVPIAPEEIKECLKILGSEVPDTWCRTYFGSGLQCVTLQGEGWPKDAVREWCSKEIAKSNSKS
ncbi:hypothetical protein LTR05_008134 [Lithohypha guttulata]|uniref:DNA replication factor Cdt1 C-terminal domain-containing protein n=1 Tax=Lithohypha guttulata TaxID=1690604 RepID=A0AAN7STV0_9EURO|nr:hypothetical protein LTR05_008134 [Lithohypha guttulata]